MGMFGAHEVAIISRFNDELHEWADVDVIEHFMQLCDSDRVGYIERWDITGDNVLTYLYLKTVVFKLNNGHRDKVVNEMIDLGISWPDNVVPLFN